MLVEAQAGLLQVLSRIGPEDWSTPSTNEGWSVRHLLLHLSTSEAGFLPTLRRMAAGEGGVPSDFDPDRWNASQVRRRSDTPVEQLRAELVHAHREILSLLETLDAQDFEKRGYMTTGGEGSLVDTFNLIARHKRFHTRQIEAALRGEQLTGEDHIWR